MPFDVVELLGMATGLVVAGLLLRHGVGDPHPLLALAVLLLSTGPFILRWLRRSAGGRGGGR